MPARDESTVSNYSTYLCDLYRELDASHLDVQLQSLKGQFAQSDEWPIAFLQELSLPARTYFSEVVKVV